MNKLQLYIKISLNGYKSVLEINADEEVRKHVVDIADAVENIDYDPTVKSVFYMLKSTDTGVFIILIRTIPSRPADHLASWVFIPYDIDIESSEIEEIVERLRGIVSKSKIRSQEQNELKEIFAREYPVLQNAGATVANYGKKYAHRYYGGDTGLILSDYIGDHRYQTTYLQYAGVILADKDSVRSISGYNLTNDPLDQMVRILPPVVDDRPYRPLIFNHPFDKPYLVPLMGTVEIVWESSSAVDIRQSIMVSKAGMRVDNLANTRPVTRPKDDEPETTQPIDTPEKPADTTPAKAVDTPAEEKSPAKKPEEPASGENSGAGRTINYDRTRVYHFEIPAKSAAISGMIHFEIKTRTELDSSPIDGYELTGPMMEGTSRSNHLIYSPSDGIQKKAIWAGAGFLAGILLSLICSWAFSGGKSTQADPAEGTTDTTMYATNSELDKALADTLNKGTGAADATQTPTAPKPQGGNLEAAIKYLETNQKWEKDKLESYPDLVGLFDDMNNFRGDRIIDYWGPKLKDSRSFSNLAYHYSLAKKANKKPRTTRATFNAPGDYVISVRSYLYTIDP